MLGAYGQIEDKNCRNMNGQGTTNMGILQQVWIVAKQIEIYFGRNISIAERQIAPRNGFTSLGKSFPVGSNKILRLLDKASGKHANFFSHNSLESKTF